MTQPKAKWKRIQPRVNIWISAVGPFGLRVNGALGTCELYELESVNCEGGDTLWENMVGTPCDVTDLMRLCEDELERRLHAAGDTMDGGELVATAVQAEMPTANSSVDITAAMARMRDVPDPYQQAASKIARENPPCTVCGAAPRFIVERDILDYRNEIHVVRDCDCAKKMLQDAAGVMAVHPADVPKPISYSSDRSGLDHAARMGTSQRKISRPRRSGSG